MLGHVERIYEERIPNWIMHARMEVTRRQGRPRSRWIEDVKKDLMQLGTRNWKNVDRQERTRIALEANGHHCL